MNMHLWRGAHFPVCSTSSVEHVSMKVNSLFGSSLPAALRPQRNCIVIYELLKNVPQPFSFIDPFENNEVHGISVQKNTCSRHTHANPQVQFQEFTTLLRPSWCSCPPVSDPLFLTLAAGHLQLKAAHVAGL